VATIRRPIIIPALLRTSLRLKGITRRRRLTTAHRSGMLPRCISHTVRRMLTTEHACPIPTVVRATAERAVLPIGAGKRGHRSPTRKARPGGRPSQAAALELRERILKVATELFLTEGYGSTSIEAVAARAGISKRTFYHRFPDKAALFAAVVHRIVEQVRPPPEVPLLQGATLEEILRRLAGLLLRAALAPQAIALQRLVTAESVRFPNLVRAVYEEGWAQQATALIGDLLARELRDPQLSVELRRFEAEQFLHMVVALPQRRIIGLGVPLTPGELDAWADGAVNLFLNGCRGLGRTTSQRR
jgi:TetR/AcrR family transcriptional regulator, mexJK operon transcriptional repressor